MSPFGKQITIDDSESPLLELTCTLTPCGFSEDNLGKITAPSFKIKKSSGSRPFFLDRHSSSRPLGAALELTVCHPSSASWSSSGTLSEKSTS